MPATQTRILKIDNPGPTRTGIEAAGQTYVKGDFVIIDANGAIAIAAAAGNSVAAATPVANHLAIANVAATGVTGAATEIVTLRAETVVTVPLCTTDAAQAFAQAQVGKAYDIRRCTNGSWGLDVAGSTNQALQVIGRDPNTPAADTWGAVICGAVATQWAK
jgi:hypothetical protein